MESQLIFNADGDASNVGSVMIRGLDSDALRRLRSSAEGVEVLRAVLRVTVLQPDLTDDDNLPDMFGRYDILDEGVRFTPHFPFEPGVSYRAFVDYGTLGLAGVSSVQFLDFSLPKTNDTVRTAVERVFPSSDSLPENLLRFYIGFSNPMQHGRAEAEIAILGPDDEPVADVLYRAPLELWDREMRRLTVLLDPGRLKRAVGPNRELGPPLRAGVTYTLKIGAGMLDAWGMPLTETTYKRFSVSEAVRERVAVEGWKTVIPRRDGFEPLVLVFPRPLDWASLAHSMAVSFRHGGTVDGRITIDENETRWRFTPTAPWEAGSYDVHVSASLEDVCGNGIFGPFDRPLRPESDLQYETASRSIGFEVA